MKITQVNTYFLKHQLEEPIAHGSARHTLRHVGLVEIVSDEGIVGWGEGISCPSKRIIAERLIGRDPRAIREIWSEIAALGVGALGFLGGIDMALHDLVGKLRGVPVCELLGRPVRSQVLAYASGLYRKDRFEVAHLLEEAKGYSESGFRHLKMKVGFDPKEDVELVRAVRDTIGDSVDLAIDANCGYDRAGATYVAKALVDEGVSFFEEPLDPSDTEGHRLLKEETHVPLAGGELMRGVGPFETMAKERALDILQPDLSICGGFSSFHGIRDLARERDLLVMPHMWGGILRLAASLHALAVVPLKSPLAGIEPMLEYDLTENPFRTSLSDTSFPTVDGTVAIPSSPGLGVEIDRLRVLELAGAR